MKNFIAKSIILTFAIHNLANSQTHTNAYILNDVFVNHGTYASGSTGDGKGNLILFGDGSNGAGWQSSIKWSGLDGFNSANSTGTRINAEITVGNIGSYGKGDLIFKTKGTNDNGLPTEKLRISSNGNIGIGTTQPTGKLHVSSSTSGDAIFRLEADTDNNNESDNPLIQLRQDGGALGINMGYSEGNFGGNIFGIGTRYSGVEKWDTFTINTQNGNIGIGTKNAGSWKLAVNGNIRAKEIKVETGWADYVFKEGYDLPTLEEVEKHIKEKGHLINIPSAKEVEENGIQLGEMNKLLLEKIEELTLYVLELKEDNKKQDYIIEKLLNKIQK